VLEELLALLKGGVGLSPASLVLIAVVALATSGIGAYLAEKFRGVATKEDVADITRLVEAVREAFGAREAAREQQYRLQLAALDKRLAVHQEAYARWRRLFFAVHHPEEVGQLVSDNQRWLDDNCLYLAREAEDAFVSAQGAAWLYRDLLAAEGPTSALVKESWEKVETCGAKIRAAVGLPPIGVVPGLDDKIRAEQSSAAGA
jgi:hypothetical protein